MSEHDALRVEVDGSTGVPRLIIAGELDLASADIVRAAIDPAIGPNVERLDLDLARVSFIDSSGLSVFIELAAQVPLRVVGASPAVRRIITVTGLDDLLGLDP